MSALQIISSHAHSEESKRTEVQETDGILEQVNIMKEMAW